MADNSDKIKKQVADLIRSNKLTKDSADYYKKIESSLDRSGATLADWQRILRAINDSLDKTSDNLSYIQTAFQESVQELSETNIALNQQRSSLNKLSNIARDLRDIRQGEKEFTTDTLKKLKEKARTEKSNLEIARNLVISQGKSTKAIDSNINDTNTLLESYQKIEDVNNRINKEFGLSSGLVKGLGATLKKVGFGDFSKSINDAAMETSMLGQKADQLGESKGFSANAQFAKSLFKNITASITPLKIFEITVGLIVKSFLSLDKMTGDLAKNLGISYKQSTALNKEFISLSNNSKNIFLTTKNINESFGELADRFSVTEGFSDEMLSSQTELTKQAGYSVEAASELSKFGLLNSKSTKEITKNALGAAVAFNAQNKSALNEKKLLESISKTSSAIQLSLGNSTTELILAAATAKKYGLELSQVENIAGSLLDFESSISNELEAELLLNKDLNLEKARQYALNNDLAGVAEEIAKQVGSAAEFGDMNRIQQEAIAKAVGMSRDDLAKSLQEQEALARLGTDATTAQEAYNKLVSQGLSQEAIAAKLGDDKLADQLAANSIQERFNQSLQKAQEIFVNIASILTPIISAIGEGVAYMANMGDGAKILLGTLVLIKGAMMANNALRAIGTAIEERKTAQKVTQLGLGQSILSILGLTNVAGWISTKWKARANIMSAAGAAIESYKLTLQNSSLGTMLKTIGVLAIELASRMGIAVAALATNAAVTFGLGVAVATAAAIAGYYAIKSLTKADDLMSEGTGGSGYGNRVLLAGKDAYSLNNSDTIVAGTNLNQGGNNQTQVVQSTTDMSTTNALLEKIFKKTPEMAPLGMYEVQ